MTRYYTIPGERVTQQVMLGSAWLVFLYALLLTLFELIELLRPKPRKRYACPVCHRLR